MLAEDSLYIHINDDNTFFQEYTGRIELTMETTLDDYYKKAKSVIAETVAKNDVVSDCVSEILGVNVYNAVYCENYIISRYFVMYGEEENKKIEYGDFVIETNEYKKMSKLYRI